MQTKTRTKKPTQPVGQAAPSPWVKFKQFRDKLSQYMIERDAEIELVLTALVAGESICMVGSPGTGKTMLADAVTSWIDGKKFSVLLTKFTNPEEVFGPISLHGLKNGDYQRIIHGMMPEADVVFIDEIFKGSSAILNTFLRILNDKMFKNGLQDLTCPLQLCMAASNEWPNSESSKELSALYDRFLIRKEVNPIGADKGLHKLTWGLNGKFKPDAPLYPAELADAQSEARAMVWTDKAKKAFVDIVKAARAEGIQPGDRRLRKSAQVVQAYAWLNNHGQVINDSLTVLNHTLWEDPREQPRVLAKLIGKIAIPDGAAVQSLLSEVDEIERNANLKDLASSVVSMRKLNEVIGKLKELKTPKGDEAAALVESRQKAMKVASLESVQF